MKTTLLNTLPSVAMATLLWCGLPTSGQAADPSDDASGSDSAEIDRQRREGQFKTAFTKATLSGRWCLIEDEKLGAAQEDKYVIKSVTKLAGDVWLINARVQYGQVNFVAPIPVKVKWAGDTPVIVVDNVGVPGGRKYSARVVIFNNTYAGTWSGGERRGLLNGVITHDLQTEP